MTNCASGQLDGADQDLYAFTIAPEDARQFFILSVEAEGVSKSLTRVQLFRLRANGGSPQSLFVFETPDGSLRTSDLILLGPGSYILGISAAGGPETYNISVDGSGDLPAAIDVEPNDDRALAMPVESDFDLSGDLAGDNDWFRWTIPASDPDTRWQLGAQTAAGASFDLELYDANNRLLARTQSDRQGQATLFDLGLEAGSYLINVVSRDAVPYRLSAEIGTIPVPGYETEPNDRVASANFWTPSDSAYGRIGEGDTDYFQLHIDDSLSQSLMEIRLETNARPMRHVCLQSHDPGGTTSHCRDGIGTVTLVDLALQPGDYEVSVTGNPYPAEQYSLTTRVTGARAASVEVEPNDTYQQAAPLGDDHHVRGRFVGDDTDVYELRVTGDPQLWRFQAVGDSLAQLRYISTNGQSAQLARSNDQRHVQLTNLYLLAGIHYIEVRGTSGEYRLIAVPLGAPPPGLELEPNSTADQANRINFDETRIGLLTDAGDEDIYRFSVTAEEHVTITVTPPEDGAIDTLIFWDNLTMGGMTNPVAGEPFVFESILSPGDYEVALSAHSDPVDSPYTILLTRADPFMSVIDQEPNDSAELAAAVPPSLIVRGTPGTRNDIDWYVLPTISEDTALTIHHAPQYDLAVYDSDENRLSDFAWNRDEQVYAGILRASAPQPFYLRIGGHDTYDMQLDFGDAIQPAQTGELPVTLAFRLDENALASYWYVGQVASGTLHLINNDPARSLDLMLTSHTSHYKLNVSFAQTEIALAPGEQADVPVQVTAAADLPTGTYRLMALARTAAGDQATAAISLSALPESAPLLPQQIWLLPESMLGGMNAAALSLGAEIVTDDQTLADAQRTLHDGYTVLEDGFRSDAGRLPLALTIQLAGTDSVPVVGILLNPQSSGEAPYKLKDFELWLSTDGQTYTQALTGQLTALPVEQVFPLPEPTMARYAQLRLLNNHAGNRGFVELGEWKVVAAPGVSFAESVNLADPQNGGHIVYETPQQYQPTDVVSLLVPNQDAYPFEQEAGSEAEWVLGFQQDRAAQVAAIDWDVIPDAPGIQSVAEVTVWASGETPVGPWTLLGSWTLTPGTNTFTLPQPMWARYLRFVVPAPAQKTALYAPDVIRVWESPTDEDYRSVVAEWGQYNRSAVYEWLNPVNIIVAETSTDNNESREQATHIRTEQQLHDQVQIGVDVDWYQIDVPADQNTVTLDVTGDPTVRVTAIFEDGEGNPLPTMVENVSPNEATISALVPPESTVYFRLEEPPRSIIFTWDNSASVGKYYSIIYNSLSTFIEGVTPGREVVNFLPFGGHLMLETWGEQPAALQQALSDYARTDNSSDAESSLLQAANELALREGTKAIFIITDGISSGYNKTAELWDALDNVRPRIFSLHVDSAIHVGDMPANEQSLLQSWASVNGGYYDYLRSRSDLETAFERATVWLRRPANYGFSADTSYVEPPTGTLQLVSEMAGNGDESQAGYGFPTNAAVEIILDASGSMTQPLEGRTRIDVAKQVLLDLIGNQLPEGTSFALRVFGNREGNYSCRTDLEVPLQPLDRAAVQSIVQGITVQTDANTPIAQSLQAVADDLASSTGHKVVILLTDGQETCNGSPEAAITALRERGIDVRVNIVGFAVTDAALKAEFERWAQLGGGQYFDASSSDELQASLQAVLGAPYRVLDTDGQVVAGGVVDGEPVTLPAGVYTVEMLTDPPMIIESVIIRGEEDVILGLHELR